MTSHGVRAPGTSTLIKLCSVAVHAEELAEQVTRGVSAGPAAAMDARTILSMMGDPDIREYLRSLPPALLPVKRNRT